MTHLMVKDVKLSQAAAEATGSPTPLAAMALSFYETGHWRPATRPGISRSCSAGWRDKSGGNDVTDPYARILAHER